MVVGMGTMWVRQEGVAGQGMGGFMPIINRATKSNQSNQWHYLFRR